MPDNELDYLYIKGLSGDQAYQFSFDMIGSTWGDKYPEVYFKINDGSWIRYWFGTQLSFGGSHTIYFKGVSNYLSVNDRSQIRAHIHTNNFKYEIGGNLMSLIDETCQSVVIPNDYCFANLFYELSNCEFKISLPATTLKPYCYFQLFYKCSSLIEPPELPALRIESHAYDKMFYNCSNMEVAPELPATFIDTAGCYGMFENCTSLTYPPELPLVNVTSLGAPIQVMLIKDVCWLYFFSGFTYFKFNCNFSWYVQKYV